jgi:hypothetical protein
MCFGIAETLMSLLSVFSVVVSSSLLNALEILPEPDESVKAKFRFETPKSAIFMV